MFMRRARRLPRRFSRRNRGMGVPQEPLTTLLLLAGSRTLLACTLQSATSGHIHNVGTVVICQNDAVCRGTVPLRTCTEHCTCTGFPLRSLPFLCKDQAALAAQGSGRREPAPPGAASRTTGCLSQNRDWSSSGICQDRNCKDCEDGRKGSNSRGIRGSSPTTDPPARRRRRLKAAILDGGRPGGFGWLDGWIGGLR